MPDRHPDARTLDELRARVAAIEGVGGTKGDKDVAVTGLSALDRTLPWGGLPRGCLHELSAPANAAAAAVGIAAAFAARLSGGRPVMWVGTGLPPHAPGLIPFGLPAEQLILVRPSRSRDVLWAAEEALSCPELGALWAEHRMLGFRQSRRLQLAAADSGVSCLFVHPAAPRDEHDLPPSAAVTRWRAAPAPSAPEPSAGGLGAPRWRLALLRGRGAKPRNWIVEWDDATNTFALAAPAGNRPDREAAA